jgi:hypothetical protein
LMTRLAAALYGYVLPSRIVARPDTGG